MNSVTAPRITSAFRLLRLSASLLVSVAALSLTALAADSGSITGAVTSAGTRNALQGALVTIPSLNRSTLTDSAGEFTFKGLPAGVVDVVVSYSGFTDATQKVSVGTSASNIAVQMKSSETVVMDAFTVQSVKEGQALSITEQRNAANIKNVTALDEWGILPTQNVGELFTRLPGVSFSTDEDDLINNINLRGMVSSNGQSFTRLVVDGMSSTGVGGNGRSATMHSFSAATYEQIELISGQTPDKRADSIGGQINLKTRSPLAMSESQRIDYNLTGRYNPATGKRNPALSERPYGYVGTVGYTKVFDVAGGSHNLGIGVNLTQQKINTQFDYDLMQYPSVVDSSGAFFRDFDKRSGTNERFITAVGLRADYRVSESTTVSARFIYNAGSEPFFHYTFVNPFFSTNGTVYDPVTNPAGGIVAGSTSTRTEIRATGNAEMLLTPRRYSFTSNNPTSSVFFDHDFGRLKIDHAWRISHTHWDLNAGRRREGGQLTLRTQNPIGFILDNSNPAGRVFTQTAASAATDNVYDPASYRAFVVTAVNTTTAPVAQTSNQFNMRSTVTNTDEWSGTVNATYLLPTAIPFTLKGGLDTVNRRVNGFQPDPRRWYAVAGTVLSGYPLVPLTTFEKNHGGQRLPVYDPFAIVPTLGDASKWYEDVNFNAVQRLTGQRHMKEAVDAGYLQGQTNLFGGFNLLGGLRIEHVKESTWTYFRARTNLIATQPDPYKRAAMDFNRQATRASYTKLFPSVHAAYDLTKNLKARASWSTSYARPDLLQLIPGVTVNDTTQTVTIGNPLLRPQLAKNVDVKLEYYFANSGIVSVGAYEKNITDYFSGLNYASGDTVPNTPDNGFDGLYGGYSIFRPANIGSVQVRGLEFDYKQRLTFLPGAWRGLLVRANYTILSASAKFVFTATQVGFLARGTRDIPGMQPQSGNIGLQYTYGKFGASYDVNYTSEFPFTTIATLASGTSFQQLFAYRKALTRANAGVTYRIRPEATLYLNVSNLGETGPDYYTYLPTRPRNHYVAPMTIVGGVQGRF